MLDKECYNIKYHIDSDTTLITLILDRIETIVRDNFDKENIKKLKK